MIISCFAFYPNLTEDLQNLICVLKCHSAGSHDPSADQQHCADNLATKPDPYQLDNSFSPFSTLRLVHKPFLTDSRLLGNHCAQVYKHWTSCTAAGLLHTRHCFFTSWIARTQKRVHLWLSFFKFFDSCVAVRGVAFGQSGHALLSLSCARAESSWQNDSEVCIRSRTE